MKNIIYFIYNFAALTFVVTGKQVLHVGGLLELSNHWYENYVNFFVTILEHAFGEIDNRTDILADYSLKLITKDTQGQSGLAARRMFELMTDGPPIVAVLGPTLSPELTIVGQIAPYYDVLQLSFLATTSTTIDQEKFPTLFKVNHILDNLNPLRIKMMQFFNWSRVGTIFFQDDIDVSQMNIFHDLVKQHNMTLVTSAVVSYGAEVKVQMARLKQYDVRIIMGSFHWREGARIFCEAYRIGLYGSNHVWILSGPGLYKNWIMNSNLTGLGCTYEEIVKASDGHFTLDYELIQTQNEKIISGQTPTEVADIFKAKLAGTSFVLSQYYGWVYDSAWALALGLNNSLRDLNDSGLNGYVNSPYYLGAILKGMREVRFEGLSGPISFNEFGGRVGVSYIEQNFNNTRTTVGRYNQITDNLTWFVPVNQLWADGAIPKDRFIYHRVMVAPSIPSLVMILIGNCVCSLVAFGFLAFNVHYRNNSHIKLSSPMINNVMLAGSILMLTCVFISSLDYGHLLPEGADKSICMVRVWLMCLGFTSLFGALFSKTWRVHIIFRDYRFKKTSIKDYHLFGIIIFLLMIDCIILVSWSVVHALQKENVVRNTKAYYNVSIVISEVYTYCYHPYENYWYVSVYIYKGLLLAFGVFLAWETRHVTIPALNDSRYIGFCIYNVVIVCVFGVPLAHVLPTEEMTLNFVLLSALVMFCTTMCLCILFIPKTKLRNKINGRFLNPSLNSATNQSGNTSSVGPPSPQQPAHNKRVNSIEISHVSKSKEISVEEIQTIDELRNENNRLRMQIASETMAIARLKRDILHFTGNIHFYKIGNDYIVFQTEDDNRLPEKKEIINNS